MTIFESQWLCLGKMLLWLNCLFWGLRTPLKALWGKVTFLVDKRSLWKAVGAPENFPKNLGTFVLACFCVQMFVLSFFCVFVYMFVFACFCVYMFVLACHNLECLPSHCQSDTPLLIRPPSCLQLQQLFSFSLLS